MQTNGLQLVIRFHLFIRRIVCFVAYIFCQVNNKETIWMCLLKVLMEILTISHLYNNYYSIFEMLGKRKAVEYTYSKLGDPTTLLP